MNSFGVALALIGGALSALFACVGSAIGVGRTGQAAAGVISENPSMFTKVLILQLLPGTQGIYGFLAAIMVMIRIGMLGGTPVELTVDKGFEFFLACMPIAIVGLLSAIYQGKVAVSAIHMTAKQPDASARGITMTALVETYAILALLVSILLILVGIKL